MKPIIHRGYFTEVFKQLKTAGIVMSCILMMFNIAPLITNLSARLNNRLLPVPSASSMATVMMLFVYIASLVLTFIAFNWLNRRSTSDFYHALPIKRSRIYWSTLLAVALWIAIGVTGYALVHAFLYLVTGTPFNYVVFLCVYVNMLIGIIQVVGVVSLACALSGTRFVNLFSAVAILLTPRALLMILALFINLQSSFLPVTRIFFLFDPSYNIFATPYMTLIGSFADTLGNSYIASPDFCSILAMLYSLVHACLLAFLGCIAFKRRASESAGMPMRSRFLQGAIRTAFGLLPLLLLALLILNASFVPLAAAFLILFSFTVYCLYELISTKSAKRMLLSMPLYTICIGIAALYLFVPKLIVKAASLVKADADSIASFELVTIDSYDQYFDPSLSGIRIDDPEAVRICADAYQRAITSSHFDAVKRYTVRIHRKNGSDLIRNLAFTVADTNRLADLLEQNEAYREKRASYPDGTIYYQSENMRFSEAREVAAFFRTEYEALSEKDRIAVSAHDNTPKPSRSCYLLRYSLADGINSGYGTFFVTDLTPKTAQCCAEILSERYDEHTKDALLQAMKWMETGDYPNYSNGIVTVTKSHPDNMKIGSDMIIDFDDLHYNLRKNGTLPKDACPELYELLRILCEAELSDNAAQSVTVTIGNIYANSDYYDTLAFTGILLGNGQSELYNLKLSDEQFSRVQELFTQHIARIRRGL